MKNKYIPIELFEKIIKPDEKLTYSQTSPFPVLNIPSTNGLFMAYHGVTPVVGVSSVCGTAYTCRVDPTDSKPLNFDVYSFVVGTSSTLQVKKVEPRTIDFHRADDLPEFMNRSAPQEIKDQVQQSINQLPKKISLDNFLPES